MNSKKVVITEDKNLNITISRPGFGASMVYSYATQYPEILEEIVNQLKDEPNSIDFKFDTEKKSILTTPGQTEDYKKSHQIVGTNKTISRTEWDKLNSQNSNE